MKVIKHIIQQPFITATGAAALLHSTWALGTLFAGVQPEGWHLLGWLLPALLIAFALDVGQIVTSAEIRQHGLTVARGITFIVFAGATYYLQWLYIAHHMPALEIAPGVSAIARATVVSMRDAALWVIPALLPLSTLLYTLSSSEKRIESPAAAPDQPPVTVVQVAPEDDGDEFPPLPAWLTDEPVLPELVQPGLPVLQPVKHAAHCEACGWQKEYDSARAARAALSTHQGRYCTVIHAAPSSNGHSHKESES